MHLRSPHASHVHRGEPELRLRRFEEPAALRSERRNELKAKAYPTIRELRVAKDLGDRGLVGWICPTAVVGYQSTMNRLADSVDKRVRK